MMFIGAVLIILVLLVVNEIWWRQHRLRNEFSRKFIHITVGSFVAFWPYLLTWDQIKLLSLIFLVAVAISKYLHIFQAIHSVQRPTWGEFFFALAVGVIAFITHDKLIYTTALLQMSLADGLAAVFGIKYGNSLKYLVLGHPKSVLGTLTFFVVSLLILLGYSSQSSVPLTFDYMVTISAAAGLIENLAIQGFDNLLVPLVVTLLLTHHLF